MIYSLGLQMEKHEHDHKLKIKRIRADNEKYTGTTGDKAVIYWTCDCNEEVAIEMGDTESMAVKYNILKKAIIKK